MKETHGCRSCEHSVHKIQPDGKMGMIAVKRLGRDYKTGGFDKIAKSAGKEYGSAAAGKRVAGAIYWNKVHKRG